MLDLLLPRNIDNTYRGHKVALGLFGFLVFSKLTMGLNCVFNGHFVARNVDGIPFDSYTPAAGPAGPSSWWRSAARGGTSVRRVTRGGWPSGACGWTSACSPRWRTARWC